jgi:hypothetical protein
LSGFYRLPVSPNDRLNTVPAPVAAAVRVEKLLY